MQRWKASESCAVVGIGSVGKTNLIQHLADPEVYAHYNADAATFKAVVIDPNMLGALPQEDESSAQVRAWAGYELMMHRLFLAFYPFEVLGQDDAKHFYEAYQALQDGSNPLYAYMGLRYFELGLQLFMRRGVRIVFMFDEFEEWMRQMPVKFFQSLRGLRDAYKQQLSYLTFTRAPLPVVAERLKLPALDMEPFLELFTDNVCYVGPYNEADARRMVGDVTARHQVNLQPATVDFLLSVTGRYAGLLRAVLHAAQGIDGQALTPERQNEQMAALAARPNVKTECRTIWTSLTPNEQIVLKAVARLAPYTVTVETEQAVAQLVQKRLLQVDRAQQRLEIQPPLFRAFVGSGPEPERV
jgi:hypothetical protein